MGAEGQGDEEVGEEEGGKGKVGNINFFFLSSFFVLLALLGVHEVTRLSCLVINGILVSPPTSPALEGGFLTTGPPGKFFSPVSHELVYMSYPWALPFLTS